MTFSDYLNLKQECDCLGIESEALSQLLHLIQAKEMAKEHYRAYLHDMDAWEKNVAEFVKRDIKAAQERISVTS